MASSPINCEEKLLLADVAAMISEGLEDVSGLLDSDLELDYEPEGVQEMETTDSVPVATEDNEPVAVVEEVLVASTVSVPEATVELSVVETTAPVASSIDELEADPIPVKRRRSRAERREHQDQQAVSTGKYKYSWEFCDPLLKAEASKHAVEIGGQGGVCSLCEVSVSEGSARAHMESHYIAWFCGRCPVASKNRDTVIKHLKRLHSEEGITIFAVTNDRMSQFIESMGSQSVAPFPVLRKRKCELGAAPMVIPVQDGLSDEAFVRSLANRDVRYLDEESSARLKVIVAARKAKSGGKTAKCKPVEPKSLKITLAKASSTLTSLSAPGAERVR